MIVPNPTNQNSSCLEQQSMWTGSKVTTNSPTQLIASWWLLIKLNNSSMFAVNTFTRHVKKQHLDFGADSVKAKKRFPFITWNRLFNPGEPVFCWQPQPRWVIWFIKRRYCIPSSNALREIPQNDNTFASNLIPTQNGLHVMVPLQGNIQQKARVMEPWQRSRLKTLNCDLPNYWLVHTVGSW